MGNRFDDAAWYLLWKCNENCYKKSHSIFFSDILKYLIGHKPHTHTHVIKIINVIESFVRP